MTLEGVQKGENGASGDGEIFRPCLIGGKSGGNPTLPQYHDAIGVGSGSFASLDMLRLRLHFSKDGGEYLDERASLFPVLCRYSSYTAKIKPGGWRSLHTFGFDETSAALGIGWMDTGCRVDMCTGFLEFNPNKLGDDPEFKRLWGLISPHVKAAEVVRYDLAVDVPITRNTVRLQKDGRKYKQELSSSLTEYLGCRNVSGYVKLYDKTEESGLDVPRTRVELTCDGTWTVEKVGEKWPTVYRVSVDDDVRGITRVAVMLMAEKIKDGGGVEDYLKMLDHKTRKRVRSFLQESDVVPFPEMGAAAVMMQACNWAASLAGAQTVAVHLDDSGAE